MNLTAEEFVEHLVERRLIGLTRSIKVARLLDAWIRQEFTGPHSRQVEHLRRCNADLRAVLEALVEAVDKLDGVLDAPIDIWISNCTEPAIQQARAALAGAGE